MIRDLHDKLMRRETTAVALAEQHLATIAATDKDINAFLTVSRDAALAAAAATDARIAAGEEIDLLDGIPFAIKDAICTKGIRTTSASRMLEHYVPPYNATVIEKLAAVGAVPLGKTNMDEFAMGASTENSAFGMTYNPLSHDRVAGGSSGGSAAAVAAGQAVWALGSDTGGSIRQPAAFCGCVGLKPTYGRVSRYGLIAMASSLDQIGPLTHSVEDAAIVLSRIAGRDPRDATSAHSEGKQYENYLTGDIAGKRIGVLDSSVYKDLDPQIVAAMERGVVALRDAGAVIETIALPHLHHALSVYYIIMPCEVSSNMARFDGIRYGFVPADDQVAGESLIARYEASRRYGLGAEVKRRIMLGTYALSAGYYDQYYNKAQKVRALIRRDFEEAFAHVDAIFMPTAPEVAFRAGTKTSDPLTMYLSDIFTVAVNLAGVPAISLPVGMMTDGDVTLPVGGQLIGKWFDEETLLAVADVLEKRLARS